MTDITEVIAQLIASRDSLPASSAAEGRRGSIERLLAALHDAVFELSGLVKNFGARLDAAARELANG